MITLKEHPTSVQVEVSAFHITGTVFVCSLNDLFVLVI